MRRSPRAPRRAPVRRPRRAVMTAARATIMRTPKAPKAPRAHPEADYQAQITALATLHHWRWCHFPDSRWLQGDKGLPDLILTRSGRLVFIEVKATNGRVRAEQHAWMADLKASGAEVYVFRPRDWDTVQAVLQ